MRDLDILESWKEIADYLKKAERTCRRWEKDFDLPVHRMDGSPKARVFAYKSELDQWIRKMLPAVDESQKRRLYPKTLNRTLAFALALIALGLIGWVVWMAFFAGRAPAIDSIAVLPLENISGDPEQEYFALGMHEALITELSKISGLKVISRPAVARFKDSEKSLSEIAGELNVEGIIAGSALEEKGRVRISIQLIDPATGQNLWAEKYNKDYRDILILHSQAAKDIARELKVELTPEEEEYLAQEREVNPEAHKAYLLGFFHDRKLTGEGARKSIECFQRAIEIDPNFALAYTGLSRAYAYLTVFTATEPTEAFPKAKAAALRALEVDDSLPEAHLALGWVLATYDWDWKGAEREFRRALELNCVLPYVGHRTYAWFLAWMGRFDEAIALIRQGREFNPLDLGRNRVMGVVLFCARLYDQAIEEQLRVLDVDPYFRMVHNDLGNAYLQKGRYEEAIAEFQTAAALSKGESGRGSLHLSHLGYAYAVTGNSAEALKILEALKADSEKMYVAPLRVAQIYIGLGLKEEAFQWLEKAYRVRDGDMCVLKVWPHYDPLRSDPRFQDLLRRMNFPE